MKKTRKGKNSVIPGLLKNIQADIKRYHRQAGCLRALRPIVDSLSFKPNLQICYSDQIDFNWPTHEQTIEIIKAFGGKWNKTYHETSITYSRTESIPINGTDWMVRVYGGKPPESCKLVECGTEIIPASTRKKYKLDCGVTADGESASSSEQAVGIPSVVDSVETEK